MWTRIASRAMAAVVALVAGVISYGHIRQVASASGELDIAAALLPVGIDGLIIVGTLAMLEDKRQRRYPRLSARVALAFGIAATVGFNIASAQPSWSARAVAVVPAVSFLLAVEVLVRTGRPMSTSDDTSPITDTTAAVDNTPASASVEVSTPGPVPAATPSASINSRSSRPRSSTRSRSSSTRSRSAAERVRQAVAETPDATSAEIAARLGLSERTVQRYRPRPAPTVDNSTGEGNSAAVDNSRAASAVDSSTPDLFSANGTGAGRVPLAGVLTR